jgi:hypothetical protein
VTQTSASDVLRQPAARGAGWYRTESERARDPPIDMTERPVCGERGNGECDDHEEAGACCFAHREPEHQQIHGHEQETFTVREQSGEEPDACGRGHQ